MRISYSDIARQFLKEHGVYRYKMKKVSEMTDSEVCRCSHSYGSAALGVSIRCNYIDNKGAIHYV